MGTPRFSCNNNVGLSWSAEKNKSKGAPLFIWLNSRPVAPLEIFIAGCDWACDACAKAVSNSSRVCLKFAATAIRKTTGSKPVELISPLLLPASTVLADTEYLSSMLEACAGNTLVVMKKIKVA